MMKIVSMVLAGLVGLGAIAEILLRVTQGLADPPLYVSDREIGYLLAPNQEIRRHGNLLITNQYSMRDREITAEKAPDMQRIFLLGDSVVNGFWYTDQSQILSALLGRKLAATQPNKYEVFNASTNSWGPQNELAYLKRYGLFDADTLILVINTEDLFATKPNSLAVGKTFTYRDRKPALALIEFYQLYLATPSTVPELEQLRLLKTENLAANLAAIREIKAIATQNNTEFILVLTPLLREFQAGSTPEETAARMSLQELIKVEKINYLDFLEIWSDFPQPEFLYRDAIHPSPQGNNKIIEQFAEKIED